MTAMTVFLAIAAVGFVLLLVSMLFGELFDHLEHDVGFGDHGGPGIFSTRILSVFITCFGAFGALAVHSGLGNVAATGVGMLGGFVFAGLLLVFARFLYKQQASSDVRSGELIGQLARVVIAIPSQGVGQVRLQLGEELIDKIAREADGQAVAENVFVRIEGVVGETVVVRRS